MAGHRHALRRRNGIIALGLAAIFTWILFSSHGSEYSDVYDDTSRNERNGQFWREFQPLLETYAPNCDPPTRLGNAESVGFDSDNTDPPPSLLDMPAQDVATMKEAHRKFVDAISRNPPVLPYKPHTRGLVSTAGGEYLPVLVISLRMLRRTGATLPMEVFLADWTEYEGYICDVVLPSLNAQCVVLSDILDAVPGSHTTVEKYQYKPLAMLFTSFEDILFLDADAFPLNNPEILFTSEPFTSKGLITWPDFWGPTASPLYYEISQQKQPAPNLRQSTESGEVLISRKSHLRTLLLCTYYNFWGPSYYYPLLTQGAAGEGDKETFLAAANMLNEPFYQVRSPIHALGRHKNGEFSGSTMVQYNPISDYTSTIHKKKTGQSSIPFFVHANFPKFNPAMIFELNGPAITDDGRYTRAWTAPEDVVGSLGKDLEGHFWSEIRWTACTLEGRLISWKGQTGICEQVEDYYSAIFG